MPAEHTGIKEQLFQQGPKRERTGAKPPRATKGGERRSPKSMTDSRTGSADWQGHGWARIHQYRKLLRRVRSRFTHHSRPDRGCPCDCLCVLVFFIASVQVLAMRFKSRKSPYLTNGTRVKSFGGRCRRRRPAPAGGNSRTQQQELLRFARVEPM